jgi:eukaryotic-like serine/threonine-protein kinase
MERGDLIAGLYRLDGEIGSGGTAEVWRATEQGSNAALALRRVRLSHLAPDERERGAQRLRAEAAIASLLDHPNIASVYRMVEHDGEPWLVMRYVSAPDLAELTAAGPMAAARAAGIGAQVAGALAYAHSPGLGVVHGAVTPRDVHIGQGDHVTLTGFGNSAPQGDGLARAPFLAPEVANGLEGGPQADVFSLGATLYAAVEGRSVWGDGDPEQTRKAAMKGVVDPPRQAGALAPVLMRMLESRPRERPTAAAAAQLLAEVAHSESSDGRGERTGGRRRWPWIAVAAVTALVVAVGLVVWLRPLPGVVGATAAGPVLGDPATADPCSLIRPEPLDRFGDTLLEADSGNFDRCDVVIDSAQDRFTVQLQLAQAGTALPEGVPEERDGMVIVRGAPANGECVRTLRLSDANDVRVIAKPVRGPLPDPCAVADVATDTALAVLVSGPVPRRSAPFDPGSLATVDACGLLDRATVATVPGLETVDPDPGFAGWDCDWENLTTGASVVVAYDRNRGGIGRNAGNRVQIEGHEAAARKDEDGAGCDVQILHRPYTDKRGYPSAELLIVKVDLAAPPPPAPGAAPARLPDPCARAVAVATAAVKRLPAAP